MRTFNKFAVLATVFFLSILLTACGGNAASTGGAGDPVKTTKDFFATVFSGGDVKPFICTSNAAAAEAMTKGFEGVRTSMTASGSKVTTDKLTFTAGAVNGDSTTVTVGGKLTVTTNGVATDVDYGGGQPIPVPLKNEGGTWKICG
jgi:hypothetical protein